MEELLPNVVLFSRLQAKAKEAERQKLGEALRTMVPLFDQLPDDAVVRIVRSLASPR